MTGLRIIGQHVSRKDGRDIVTGNVVYGPDISLPGMLYGKVLRSTIASGRVVRIDVSRARALAGIAAVITAADVPSTRFGYAITDEQIFASPKIRYAGEPLAAIAAVDANTADEAARLIEIEYEETPGVFDPLDAMKDGAPLVHEEMGSYKVNPLLTRTWNPSPGTNIVHRIEYARGEVERG
ncbi:MAG TPA: hypothetical protein VNO43_11940, partial [Candidatus Eisenbacteria bacterium]|nr:hypothetical protein [Candidatus Eisenbacteria bacterium]